MSAAKKATVHAVVPILGTGFNRWLMGSAPASPALSNWNALLLHLAWTHGLLPNAELEIKLALAHDQPFVWESLLHAMCAHERDKRKREDEVETATYGQEQRLLDEVAALFERETARLSVDAGVVERANRFIGAMAGPNAFADVLSLNVDRLLDIARPEQRNVRVWYPHGRAGDARNPPVFGTFRYGKSITAISASFAAFKRSEGGAHTTRAKAKTVHEANAHRAKTISDDVGWVGAAINAPLLLLGLGFDRSEIDLWHFLHLRARNHARIALESRPRIFRLTCDQEPPLEREHWNALSDGIGMVPLHLGATWTEAWNALLPMLAKEDAFTP